jgi:hypothetical protein
MGKGKYNKRGKHDKRGESINILINDNTVFCQYSLFVMMPLSIIPFESPSSNKSDCIRKAREDLPFQGFSALVLLPPITWVLLAGLALAICGLDITRLQVLSSTGNQKQRNRSSETEATKQKQRNRSSEIEHL